jgi:hypothetical protein
MTGDFGLCYLCGAPLIRGQKLDVDHVPPQRFFPKPLRRQLSPQLKSLQVHQSCNRAYRPDEEYFVLALVAYAHDSFAGRALMSDVKRGLQGGHGRGLYEAIKKGFGTVVAPDGRTLFEYDGARIRRVVWKIIRGMFFLHSGRILPIQQLFEFHLIPPTDPQQPDHPWFQVVLQTGSLCKYGGIFDMKSLGGADGRHKAHFQALLFWDRIIALVHFHDPTCPCEECGEVRATATS